MKEDPNDCVITNTPEEQAVHGRVTMDRTKQYKLNTMTYEEITYSLQKYYMCITDEVNFRYVTNVTPQTRR
jgi:hypothetical protein